MLICSLDEARAGIAHLATHIEKLCEASKELCERPCEEGNPRFLRQASILTLLALEETGKLFDIWQEASEVEDEDEECRVVVPDFRDHEAKGRKVGDLCYRMVEFVRKRCLSQLFGRLVPGAPADISQADIDEFYMQWETHFYSLCETFLRERTRAMYVDLRRDSWTVESPMTWTHVEMDNQLLMFVANVAKWYFLSEERSFSLAVRALKKMEDGIEDDETRTFALLIWNGFARECGMGS